MHRLSRTLFGLGVWLGVATTVVSCVKLIACGTAHAAVDPCGPLTGAIVENWARPPTPAEQARVEELRQACRASRRGDGDPNLSAQEQLHRLEQLATTPPRGSDDRD